MMMREANSNIPSHGSHLSSRERWRPDHKTPPDSPWKRWWAEAPPACRPLPRLMGRRGSGPGGWRAARPSWPTPVSGRQPPGCRGRTWGGRGPAGPGLQTLQYSQTVRDGRLWDCEIVRDNLGQTYWSDSTQSLQATVGHYRPAWYYQEIGSNPSYSRPPFAPFPVLHSIVTPGLMFKFRFLPSLILFLLFSDSKMLLDNCRCQAGRRGGR